MKTSLRLIACALVLFGALVMPSLAQQKGPHEGEFRTFYAAFVKAVQANDKEKIADMIAYPVSSWSIQTKGDVQEGSIKDKADFVREVQRTLHKLHAAALAKSEGAVDP